MNLYLSVPTLESVALNKPDNMKIVVTSPPDNRATAISALSKPDV
jgi:hypothetical protein